MSRTLAHQGTLVAGAFVMVLTLPLAAIAQSATQNVEVEPVTCWWRAEVAAVTVGEPFGIVLTCSVLETEAVRAVVERSRMGSAAVQFPPYEVVGGSQSPDHVTAGRRFIQYEYDVRLISEDAFGTDVPIDGMEISYRIESRVQQDAAVQGREQTYLLPPLSMRVTSLVPDDARHIREASVPTLGQIAAREFRARMLRLIALILFGVAGLTLAVALVRWARRQRTAMTDEQRDLLTNRAVLAGIREELRAVQRDTRGAGWTPPRVARALAASRVVASYLAGHAVVQRRAETKHAHEEFTLGRAWPSRRRVAVSGATTAQSLTAARAASGETGSSDLDAALVQLTAARYGRDASLHSGPLDEALETVLRASDRVSARFTRVAEATSSMRRTMRGWRPRAWAR